MAAFGVVASASPAVAQQAPPPILDRIHIKLDYHGAKGCSDGDIFEQTVRARLYEWDVFAAPAPWRLELTVTRAKGADDRYTGAAVLRDPRGTIRWFKNEPEEVASAGEGIAELPTCNEVLGAIALALTVAILPAKPSPPPAAPPPPPALPSRQELPPTDPLLPARPPKLPIVVRLGAAVWGVYATVPRPIVGVTLSGGIKYDTFSAAIQIGWDPPMTTGGESIGSLSGDLLLCGHVKKWFVPCGIAEASAIQGVGTQAGASAVTIPRGAIGGRLAADVPIPIGRPHIFFEPALDLLGAFGGNLFDGPKVIKLPQFNARLGLNVLIELDSP